MNKNSLQFCLYYKGEKECPKGTDQSLWETERIWCESVDSEAGQTALSENMTEYFNYGLRDFESKDGTPITLKALLFNRYSYWNRPDVPGFKTWYKEQYKK